jgi:hypothetical protein
MCKTALRKRLYSSLVVTASVNKRQLFALPRTLRPSLCGHAQLSHNRVFFLMRGDDTQAQSGWTDEETTQSHSRETVRRDLERRLRRVCADYPEGEFLRLVEEMTERQLSGERRANRFLDSA